MSDFAGMLDNNTDLDTRIEIASQMVKAAAEEQGYDITKFSQEELGEMIGGLVDSMEVANDNGKTAGAQEEQPLTYADVALELNKRAAAEGVDLSQLDPAQFNEVFDKVAAELSDPEYVEEVQKVAAQEAQMDHYGRVAARGFVDEINKLAADEDKKDEEEDEDEKKEKVANKVKELAGKAWGATKGFGKRVGEGAAKAERGASEHVGRRTPGGVKGPMTQEHARSRGRKILGGAAGAGAGAGGGIALHNRSKKASIEDVAGAIDTLRAAGYEI
jgi:hypothetical protein